MELTLLTPQKKLVDKLRVDEIFLPGVAGQLNILEGHSNLVTVLETGVMKWREGTVWKKGVLSTGFAEVFEGKVTVLAEVAELSDMIDQKRARLAFDKAEKTLAEGGLDDTNFNKYELKLKRAVSRVSVTSPEA